MKLSQRKAVIHIPDSADTYAATIIKVGNAQIVNFTKLRTVVAQQGVPGPLRSLVRPSRCCGRSPHCRHSPQEQFLDKIELTVCERSNPLPNSRSQLNKVEEYLSQGFDYGGNSNQVISCFARSNSEN